QALEPLGQAADGRAPDGERGAAEGGEAEGGREDDAGEPVAPASQFEELRSLLRVDPQRAVARMKEGEVGNAADERALAGRILPVDVRGDAPADGDPGVPRLGRKPETAGGREVQQITERDARLDLDQPPRRVEAEHPAEP